MAHYAVLVLMQSRLTALISQGLGDMWYLNPDRKIEKTVSRGRSPAKRRNGIRKEGSDGQTEVIPAKAPAKSRVGVSNVFLPLLVRSWKRERG